MKVLVIGGGGREHALAWKLSQSPKVQTVYVAPGNGGTARDKDLQNIAITDVPALREWAQAERIGLTVVGPEAPLAAGVVDEFRAHGLRIFGPTRAAAQLESSKAFSKAFMKRHGIPTAAYETFSDPQAAHDYVRAQGAPIVVKADGLAAGKGVVVAMTEEEAHEAIDFMLLDNKLGVTHNAGGARVVIEEFLQGEEASFIVDVPLFGELHDLSPPRSHPLRCLVGRSVFWLAHSCPCPKQQNPHWFDAALHRHFCAIGSGLRQRFSHGFGRKRQQTGWP